MAETIGFNPETERSNKVEMIKVELIKANFLKPDEKQKDQMSENLGRIFSDQLKHGTKSVAEMEMTIKGVEIKSHTEAQAKLAEEDKKILGEAVVLATRELTAEDPSLVSELFLGSKHVDNLLPKELKGLGREITKPIISSEEIDKQLNLLEITRQKTDLGNPDSVKTLSQKIEIGIDKLIHKDFDTEEEIGQQDAVLTILNEERRKLEKNEEIYKTKRSDEDKKGNVSENSQTENVEDRKFREDSNELLLEMLKKIGVGVDVPPEEFVPEGVNPITGETRESAYYSRMDITAELLAVSMKIMDPNGARFDFYRPTEWYKKLPKEQSAVIDVMIEINMAASATSYYGKDLDKLLASKLNFSFTSEKMRTLFDDKFKLVLSKMFNDLCETYTDQNLHESMRYKEGFYAIPNKKDGTLIYSKSEERYVLAAGKKIDDDGFLLGSNGKRMVLLETEENIRGGKGKRGISGEVMSSLRMIEDYKEEMAYFLAEKTNGFMKYSKDDK